MAWDGCLPCGYIAKDGRECAQRKGHWAERGDTRNGSEHGHCKPDYWRNRDKCPNRAAHATEVYGKRLGEKCGNLTRDGVKTIITLDGEPIGASHRQEMCGKCELYVIWKPK